MARVVLPESRLRARRRRRRYLVGAFVAGALAVVVGGAAALSHAPFLRISNVEVRGVHTVATTTVEGSVRERLFGSYLYIFAKDNIFIYPNKEIAKALAAAYPVFKVVEVHAEDFRTIIATIVEREPSGLWCGDICYYMDEDGVVYASAPQGSEELYVQYRGGAQEGALPVHFLNPEQFRSLAALVAALSASQSGNPLAYVAVDTEGDARARFGDGFVLIFSLRHAGGDVFERFMLALKAEPFTARPLREFEYLDLRFGDKLYYKLQGE